MPSFLNQMSMLQAQRKVAEPMPSGAMPQTPAQAIRPPVSAAPRPMSMPMAASPMVASPIKQAEAQYMQPVVNYAMTPPAPPPAPPPGLLAVAQQQAQAQGGYNPSLTGNMSTRVVGAIPSLQEIMLSAKLGLKL